MIRNTTLLFAVLICLQSSSVFGNEPSSPFSKSWTHVNGNTATLELIEIRSNWIKFKKTDGMYWTMPISDLVESDRTTAIEMNQLRNFRTSLKQDSDLETVRENFKSLKSENPDLYERLNGLAEYPIDDYEIQVNDEGIYYLQFMLKEGTPIDGEAEAMVSEHLNAAAFGDEIQFRLNQIVQEVEEEMDAPEENVLAEEDSNDETAPPSTDAPASDSILQPTETELDAPAVTPSQMNESIVPPSPDFGETMINEMSTPSCGCSDVATLPMITSAACQPEIASVCGCNMGCCQQICCAPVSCSVIVSAANCCQDSCCTMQPARRRLGILNWLLSRKCVR